MKVKIICKDGVTQTHYINPKNLSKLQQKYVPRLMVISNCWQDRARMRQIEVMKERVTISININNLQRDMEELIVAT